MPTAIANPSEDTIEFAPEEYDSIQRYVRSRLAEVGETVMSEAPIRLFYFVSRNGRPPKDLLSPQEPVPAATLSWQNKLKDLLSAEARRGHERTLRDLTERYLALASRVNLKGEELRLTCDAHSHRIASFLPMQISYEISSRASISPEAAKHVPERARQAAFEIMEEMEWHRVLMACALSSWQRCSEALQKRLLRAGLDSPQIDAIINDKALAVLTPADMGSRGGRATSARKVAAARANGRKGGRPKKKARTPRRKNTNTQTVGGNDGK